MPHEPSLRALARAHYEIAVCDDAASDDEDAKRDPTPDPSPQRGGAQKEVSANVNHSSSLTERLRALYEGSVVPMRALARLAGVTERTLYKYVRKGGWRRRYGGKGLAPAVEKRAAKCKSRPCVTGKGCGGRFIRHEDIGKPFARGLKALNSRGAVLADERLTRAKQAAEAALVTAHAEAERRLADRCGAARLRAFALCCAALVDLARARAGWAMPSWRAVRLADALEDALLANIAGVLSKDTQEGHSGR